MIDILLALYNGEKFLAEQIDSILSQTFTDWHLIICDDGSEDNSYKIASEFAMKFPEKIKVYKNDTPSGSAQANFMGMLKYVEADYIMFSDQDDVWLPEKIEKTFKKIKQIESSEDLPLLVHSELSIADRNMNVIHKRFTHYQGLNPVLNNLNRLLVQNNVTGCTIMMNREMLEIIRNVPPEKMLMHDWWFALVAAAFGKIAFVETPLILYRQHDGNQLGAVNNRSIKGAFRIIRERCRTQKRVSVTYKQAENFCEYYKDMLSEQNLDCIKDYLKIPEKNKLVRVFSLIHGRYLKQNFMAAVGQLIFS
mgnify:CR=1 FL=1